MNDEQDITHIDGVGPKRAERLREGGYETVGDIRTADPEDIHDATGLGERRAMNIHSQVNPDAPDIAPDGSPTKLHDSKDDLLEAARLGMTLEGCARSAGISYATLRNWLNRGEQDDADPEFSEFFESFSRARATGERELITEVAERDPKFVLERSYKYTKTEEQKVEHSGHIDGERQHTHEIDVELDDTDREFLDSMFGED